MDRVEGDKVKVYITTGDIHRNTKNFKDHREYIQWRFQQMGFEVYRWGWDRQDSGSWCKQDDGIQCKNSESNLEITMEYIGTIGKNVRRYSGQESGDSFQGKCLQENKST